MELVASLVRDNQFDLMKNSTISSNNHVLYNSDSSQSIRDSCLDNRVYLPYYQTRQKITIHKLGLEQAQKSKKLKKCVHDRMLAFCVPCGGSQVKTASKF